MLTQDEMLLLEEMSNGTFLLNNMTLLLESDLFLDGSKSTVGSVLGGEPGLGGGVGGEARRPNSPMLPYRLELDVRVQIGLYSVIFLLAILGNLAVILTLIQNQGMRTITNLFLLNLAIADLLVGVFCMPFTLVGIVLKDFVFGAVLCKLIPFLQAVSVSVSAWTLVAISVERYYAICHPLTSRRWQTLSHAYKIIAVVWILSLLCMSPIAFVNMLQPIRTTGRHKCREEWPDETLEKTYTVFLDMILLVVPLFIMAVKYGLITCTLWPAATHNDQATTEHSSMLGVSGADDGLTPTTSPLDNRVSSSGGGSGGSNNATTLEQNNSLRRNNSGNSAKRFRLAGGSFYSSSSGKGSLSLFNKQNYRGPVAAVQAADETPPPSPSTTSQGGGVGSSLRIHVQNSRGTSFYGGHQLQVNSQSGRTVGLLRRSNAGKSLSRKKRVIQMLGVVVLEFFVCWTPLYVMNTWYLFSPETLYETIGPLGVSLIHLLCYISSCSNPITYCFMNKSFRVAFCHVFGCHCSARNPSHSAVSQRNDSLRLARSRSLYTPNLKSTDDV